MRVYFISFFFILIIDCVLAQPPGWRMVDRFYGFRYEIAGHNIMNVGFEAAAQKRADDLGCFGWIQKSKKGTLVGEARCSKANGPKFQSWFSEGGPTNSQVTAVNFHVYEDTKIRLHYSYFKIVDESKDTCFLDPPHQCDEFSKKDDQQSNYKNDEL